jgi:Holliday junction resolvase RusA-like endonuclease
MIKNIIDLLNSADWYIDDEDIDIAKGKYKSPTTWKEIKNSIKRNTNG